jgi:hypothetical protein
MIFVEKTLTKDNRESLFHYTKDKLLKLKPKRGGVTAMYLYLHRPVVPP